MVSYLRRYVIKSLAVILGGIAILIVSIVLVANNIFFDSSQRISQRIESHINQKVSIGDLRYVFPKSFILSNFTISENQKPADKTLISVKNIKIIFSLVNFLSGQPLKIEGISFHEPKSDYDAFTYFINDNLEELINIFLSLPKGETVTISIKKALLEFTGEDTSSYISLNAKAKIKDKDIISLGKASFWIESNDEKDLFSEPKFFGYNFEFQLADKGFLVKNLEIKGQDSYLKLWGPFKGEYLQLSGFSYFGNLFDNENNSGVIARIINKFRRKHLANLIGQLPADFNIFDIDCRLRFTFPKTQIEKLNFSFNKIPCSISGDIFLEKPLRLELDFYSYPPYMSRNALNDSKKLYLKIKGNFKKDKFNGKINTIFPQSTNIPQARDNLEIDVTNLSFNLYPKDNPALSLDGASFRYRTQDKSHGFFLNDLEATFGFETNKGFRYIDFKSKIYDGSLGGKAIFDMNEFPIKTDVHFNLKNLSLNNLGDLSYHFSKVYGICNAYAYYKNYPYPKLIGQAKVGKGYLDNLDFCKWLVDFFGTPSLGRIDFESLSTDFQIFHISNRIISLNAADLNGSQIKLKGHFYFYLDDLVSGNMSLAMPWGLLKTSPKFKSLIRILGKEVPFVTFDFKLSSLATAMNFKWLDSEFRTKLKDSIPDFIERGVERKIEGFIGSMSD